MLTTRTVWDLFPDVEDFDDQVKAMDTYVREHGLTVFEAGWEDGGDTFAAKSIQVVINYLDCEETLLLGDDGSHADIIDIHGMKWSICEADLTDYMEEKVPVYVSIIVESTENSLV